MFLFLPVFLLSGFLSSASAQSAGVPLGVEESDPLSRARTLARRAGDLYRQQRYTEAEPLAREALALRRATLGAEHADVAAALYTLADISSAQRRFPEAETLHRQALAIREKIFGPEHPDVAQSLDTLAELYRILGRYADAEPLFERSLTIREKVLDPEHPDLATGFNNLGALYDNQGRFAEAEPLYKRSLAIRESGLGPEHPDVAQSLNNLAFFYTNHGRYADAEPLYRRSLTIFENALGPEHPNVAYGLNNLAFLYANQGRYADAEPLYKRGLAIREKVLGPEHPNVATTLINLGLFYANQGRYADAEPLYTRGLAIYEKTFGPEHPNVAQGLNNLAFLYVKQGRYADAEPLYRRSLTIREKALGPEHPNVAIGLNNLGDFYRRQGRYADAEPFYNRSLAMLERALGPEHPNVATNLANLAALHHEQGRAEDALAETRRATEILSRRVGSGAAERSSGDTSEQRTKQAHFLWHVTLAAALADSRPEQREALTAEAFEVAQWARTSAAARAMAGMAARVAAGGDALASAVRERQDALAEWQRLDAALVKASSRPLDRRRFAEDAELRARLAALDRRLSGLDERLHAEFPRFAEIASPKPVPLAEAQQRLQPDEALLVWAVADDSATLWAVRKDRASMARLPLGRKALADAVAKLRSALDRTDLKLLDPSDIPAFDTVAAHKLYQQLVAPAEPVLEGVRHVLLVPDGALQSLPLGTLITAEPTTPVKGFTGYRRVPWLARRYALSVLPAVSSLSALRSSNGVQVAARSDRRRPFIGIGDPVLHGDGGTARGGARVHLASLFRGAMVDVDAVRKLDPLPDTADELRAEARALQASEADLYLRERATLPIVTQAPLKDYRVLAFATHGLVAGELQGLAEPALVLTPPEKGSEEDDGLLTASRIAKLQLDADWVVLSACNTAAGDGTPGAEGLSGLAKAFFYAGSRAVLVSHWPVISEVAVPLTTGAFEALATEPGIGRAEALQRAMLRVMASNEKPHFAHPMLWAPFTVVGEGGPGR